MFYQLRDTWWQARRDALTGPPLETHVTNAVLRFLSERDKATALINRFR
jgi:hypothetical protein